MFSVYFLNFAIINLKVVCIDMDDDNAIRSLWTLSETAIWSQGSSRFSTRSHGEKSVQRVRPLIWWIWISPFHYGGRRKHFAAQVRCFFGCARILMTIVGNIQLAVQGIRAGASDFITKHGTNATFCRYWDSSGTDRYLTAPLNKTVTLIEASLEASRKIWRRVLS